MWLQVAFKLWSQSESATIWRTIGTKADCSKQWAQKQKMLSLQIWFLFVEECSLVWWPNGDRVVPVHCRCGEIQYPPWYHSRILSWRTKVSGGITNLKKILNKLSGDAFLSHSEIKYSRGISLTSTLSQTVCCSITIVRKLRLTSKLLILIKRVFLRTFNYL